MPATASATCAAGGSQPEVFVNSSSPPAYRLTCNDGSGGLNGHVWANTSNNNVTGASGPPPNNIYVCANVFDSVCSASISTLATTNSLVDGTTYYFKTWNNDYFKGDWSTTGWQNPAVHTPSSPPISASIGLNLNQPVEVFAREIEVK